MRTPLVQGLGDRLLKLPSSNDWKLVVDALGGAIPLRTCELIAKRILTAVDPGSDTHKAIHDRAKQCLDTQRYNDFMSKFGISFGSATSFAVPPKNLQKAGSFIKLYLSGVIAKTPKNPATHASLDMTKTANVASHKKRIELLLSLLLFIVRNERAHGNTMSPFRTSKSSIDRYKSYYFIMLIAYVFALGVLQLKSFGHIQSNDILKGCLDNIALQSAFFPKTK